MKRFRSQNWFDTNEMKPMYGVQIKHKGKWVSVFTDGRPLLFETEQERDNHIKEANK